MNQQFTDLNTKEVKVKEERISDWLNEEADLQLVFEKIKEVHPWTNKSTYFCSLGVGSLVRYMNDLGLESKLRNVDSKLCTLLIDFLRHSGKNPAITKMIITALSSFFSVMEKLRVVDSNPFLLIQNCNKIYNYKQQTLTFQEMLQVYKVLRRDGQSPSMDIPIFIAFFTAMRLEDVDQLTFNSFSLQSNGINLGYMTIPHYLYKRIIQYLDEKLLKEEVSEGTLKTKLLFNKPIYSSLQSILKKLRWNEKKITPGTLRHTFAAFLRALGVTEDAIMIGLNIKSTNAIKVGHLELEQCLRQIEAGQTVIEEAFETLCMFKDEDLLLIDYEQFFQQLPELYTMQLQNKGSIQQIKQKLLDLII
jgi:site-specific recombinase XerD